MVNPGSVKTGNEPTTDDGTPRMFCNRNELNRHATSALQLLSCEFSIPESSRIACINQRALLSLTKTPSRELICRFFKELFERQAGLVKI